MYLLVVLNGGGFYHLAHQVENANVVNAFYPLDADDIASGVGVEANTYCVILFHVGEGEEGGQFDVVVNEDNVWIVRLQVCLEFSSFVLSLVFV